ncbi:MAG TPA: hypothetical protein DCX41_09460 [Aequorivita sp.]|nr:hypothetical protein [Aequorivita sp.]HBL80981.1 hypothetical protein [Aequorivita sp.]|tara:strand:- start:64 stop:399 length:336 start_codon:yes stop_codon:yes gene_type:complete
MKTDMYTKTILTIIAVCLTINVVKDFELFPSVYASENIEPKPINQVMDVRLVDINTSDELNVNLKSVDTYDEVKVNVKKLETSDVLDVNIKEVGGSWITSGSSIPVQLKRQ